MNSRHLSTIAFFALSLISCTPKAEQSKMEAWKNEIMQVETDFARMAQEKGISPAFRAFAAEEVALLRGGELVIGKEALDATYSNERNPNVSLTWTPDFIDVSNSGDMAYTYGNYVFSRRDSLGNVSSDTGVFHTVWKRQKDGKWKFVWD
ncbi:YybH family protein [Ekhidna sp. To15]|uniref:YybH family protein n=1 Tax=Ekhidna sp. To15 TaxID=3395267 RepID=UPI003F51E411